jgi:hypothetical protein
MLAVDVELISVQPEGAVIVGAPLTATWAMSTSPTAGVPLHVPLFVDNVMEVPPLDPLLVVQ